MARSFAKYSDRNVLAASTAAAIVDAIGNALSTIRIQMEADGWTFALDTVEGVSMTPPNSPNHRIVIAGVDAGAPTPTMNSPDTFATALLLTGCVRVVTTGTFDWDHATCGFTGSATFSGYMRGLAAASATHVQVVYTEHALMIQIDAATNGTSKMVFLGGWGIPADPAFVESDGRMWIQSVVGGVATTGGNVACWSGNQTSSATLNHIFLNGLSNGNAHTVYCNPNTGVWTDCTRWTILTLATNEFVQNTDNRALWPVMLFIASTTFVCELESIYVAYGPLNNVVHTVYNGVSNVEGVFFLSGSFTGSGIDCIAFEMVDLDAIFGI
jgi:hypothetical protein